jgi:hypothetical protein
LIYNNIKKIQKYYLHINFINLIIFINKYNFVYLIIKYFLFIFLHFFISEIKKNKKILNRISLIIIEYNKKKKGKKINL